MAAPVGPKKVHRYTLEFKIQAVKLANHPDIQTQDVAQALDIHPFMLSKWKKDYREGKLKPARKAAGMALPKGLRVLKADSTQARGPALPFASRISDSHQTTDAPRSSPWDLTSGFTFTNTIECGRSPSFGDLRMRLPTQRVSVAVLILVVSAFRR